MSTTSGPHPEPPSPRPDRREAPPGPRSSGVPRGPGVLHAPLRELGALMVLALLGQLLLGMANTFWLKLPDSGSGWGRAVPAGLLVAHMVVAVTVLVLAVGIAVAAFRVRDRAWRIASVVGVVGILVAAGGGTAFLSQVSDDAASYAMAAGTALAIGAYALGLYQVPARRARG